VRDPGASTWADHVQTALRRLLLGEPASSTTAGPARDELVRLQRDWLETIGTCFRTGITDGHFPRDADPEQFAHDLYGILRGAADGFADDLPAKSALGLTPAAREELRRRSERRLRARWSDLPLLPMRGLAEPPPLLVVHERDDREVPWADGAAIAAAWPGARRLDTEGLGRDGDRQGRRERDGGLWSREAEQSKAVARRTGRWCAERGGCVDAAGGGRACGCAHEDLLSN